MEFRNVTVQNTIKSAAEGKIEFENRKYDYHIGKN